MLTSSRVRVGVLVVDAAGPVLAGGVPARVPAVAVRVAIQPEAFHHGLDGLVVSVRL